MDTKLYFRNEVAKYIRKLFIGKNCDVCGAKDNLHLHHSEIQFAKVIRDSLDMLNLDFREDTDDYKKEELDKITFLVLGIHLKIEYETLCPDCHSHKHKFGFMKTKYLESEIYCKFKELGGSINVNFSKMKQANLSHMSLARLLLLGSHIDYDNYINLGKGKGISSRVVKKDLREITKLSVRKFFDFYKEIEEKGILIFDEKGNYYINADFIKKGVVEDGYTRIFINPLQHLYYDLGAKYHKKIGFLYSLAGYMDTENYIVSDSGERFKTIKEIAKLNEESLQTVNSLDKLMGIRLRKENFICRVNGKGFFFNPNFIFGGSSIEMFNDIEKLIA